MSFIRKVFGFVIVIVVAVFAVMNRHSVSFVWSPVHASLELPLYVIALGALVLGFVLGGMVVWFNGGKVRREKHRQKRQIQALEKELEDVQAVQGDDAVSGLFPALPKARMR